MDGVPWCTIWHTFMAGRLLFGTKLFVQNGLYKVKKNYLTFRDIDDQKFVPMDIIPLVNTAWAKSFARVDSSRKEILKRGWNPLNYVLLDHPELNKTDTTAPEDGSGGELSTTATSKTTLVGSVMINKDGKTVSNYLNHLLVQESKDEGRKRKYEEQQQRKKDNDDKINVLKGMAKITSGKLVGNDHHILGTDLLRKVQENEDQEQQKKQAVMNGKSIQQDKEREKFRKS
jgi:hypothetical protein